MAQNTGIINWSGLKRWHRIVLLNVTLPETSALSGFLKKINLQWRRHALSSLLEVCMGMGKTGIPWVPWDSHGNGSKISHGMGMGWEWSHWNGRELVRKICSRTPLLVATLPYEIFRHLSTPLYSRRLRFHKHCRFAAMALSFEFSFICVVTDAAFLEHREIICSAFDTKIISKLLVQ